MTVLTILVGIVAGYLWCFYKLLPDHDHLALPLDPTPEQVAAVDVWLQRHLGRVEL